ncbi:uncharacterized protein [Ptychodera flava]|uniref:uncharacterized protein n=1 Tax=Ptychodera flava TaxID=63121 RepID=UPI00396A2F3A
MAADIKSPESYEDEVLAEKLEWSDDTYNLKKFVDEYEAYLPQIIRICEGIYGSSDESSFSTGDVYKVHGARRENKILASVRSGPGNNFEKITIPKSFQGTLAVIPEGRREVFSNQEYSIDELLTEYKLPVKAKFVNFDRNTHRMLKELGGEDSVFTLEKEITDTYVIASTKVKGVRFMCIMTLDVEVDFEVAEEDESADYELIVDKFKLPDIEVGQMASIPYLEYYERPTVYRPEEAIYLNTEMTIDKIVVTSDSDETRNGPPPPPINRASKPPQSPKSPLLPPPIPPRRNKPEQHQEDDDDINDYEEIPDELAERRKKVLAQRKSDEAKTTTAVAQAGSTGGKQLHSREFNRDVYENYNLPGASPEKPKNLGVANMTVQEVASLLRNDIRIPQEAIDKFVQNEIDGCMLISLLKDGEDYSILVDELSITKLQAMKINKYVVDGWRPSHSGKNK